MSFFLDLCFVNFEHVDVGAGYLCPISSFLLDLDSLDLTVHLTVVAHHFHDQLEHKFTSVSVAFRQGQVAV